MGEEPTYSYETDPASARNPIFSFLLSVTQTGYKRKDGDGYLLKSLPPLEFEYTRPDIDETVHDVDRESLENLPYGLDGANYQWVDLDGEGLSGIPTEQAEGWFYKCNLSPINVVRQNGQEGIEARFLPVELVARKPSLAAISGGQQQFLDLAGDGQLDLVEFSGPTPGFYERTHDQRWEQFTPFISLPNIPWNDPNLKFVDLTGDGHADVLITEDDVFTWYPSLAEEGFGLAEKVRQAIDEEKGPRLVFADGTQSMYLADMSGDGLTDLVRIRNGEVCYWPNLGYGRFGTKVTMDNAPYFDRPELFDQRRIRLADIDGSGAADIIYLGHARIDIYRNQTGNGWSQQEFLANFPPVDNLSDVMAVDLLGNGTACLVWSSPLAGDATRPMRYIDLMGGQKPHLLIKTVNNLGAETHVHYAPSTRFYLEDKMAGKPWITKLPFPVHVVERVETYDRISRNRFVTRYAYHHGYFDGIEREFRGFGMVEQRDTGEFAALSASDSLAPFVGEAWGEGVSNIDASSHVPPVLTKTWFHTGAYYNGQEISKHFEQEYYREGDPSLGESGLSDDQLDAMLLEDTILPPGLSPEESREASRALKGSILRVEVYALDEKEESDRPYTVSERSYQVREIQPRAENKHAVFLVHPRETIDFHYERKLYDISGEKRADPRVTHSLTLAVDDYGNVLKSATIGYGRRYRDSDLTEDDRKRQEQTLLTYTDNSYTNPILEVDNYRTPLPCESHTYELVNVEPDSALPGVTNLFWFDELKGKIEIARDLNYEDVNHLGAVDDNPWRRLIERIRTLYRKNDLTELLPPGELDPLALPGETYKLAFTPGLLAQVYQRNGQPLLPDPAMVLSSQGPDRGGYVDLDNTGHWWIPSGLIFYSATANVANPATTAAMELTEALRHFFLPRKFTDPFGHSTTTDYDPHDLLIVMTKDALENSVEALNDYRVLQPMLVTDPNGNRSEAVFDALGMVVGTAVKGKDDTVGDNLTGFDADLTDTQVSGFYDAGDPHTLAVDLLKGATNRIIYDLDRFKNTGQPVYAATLARETHASDPLPPDGLKIQISFSYSNGFGREIQKKIQAEPETVGGPLRWVGSGWTIFNNKGKPVRQYEPFFSPLPKKRHQFEFGVQVGVSPVLFYDPVERVVATLHPNHTWEKVVFNPWQQTTYDVNDTVTFDPSTDKDVSGFFTRLPDADYLPTWHQSRINKPAGDPERQAAAKAAVHANTPTVAHFDTLGRTFLTIAHNRFERNSAMVEEKYPTRVLLDIEGNQREVRDAVVQAGDLLGRIIMRYDYDMLGNRIHQSSMEAGERWMLNDVTGKPIRVWDSRGFMRRMTYDALRRPTGMFVTENNAERLAERTVYGDAQGAANNHRTRVYQVFDGAGIVTSEAYDFKGNLLRSSRALADDYRKLYDWQTDTLQPTWETFSGSTTYDALNRPTAVTTPDKSVYHPTYNEANLLNQVDVNLRGEQDSTGQPKWTPFVTNIDYNARGQRTLISYVNGAETIYEYDKDTFRLIHLNTLRGGTALQDLHYTYDPVGNITHIRDDARQTVYFNGQVIEPHCDHSYDAIYRLIEAKGREHIGQASHPWTTYDDAGRVNLQHPHDGQVLRNYTELYEYDAVGNFQKLIHQAANGSWTRGYDYNEDSLLEPSTIAHPGKKSNRLSSTTLGQTTETYIYKDTQGADVNGCMTSINSMRMDWDFEDQLTRIDLGGGGTAYYVYDAGGQRVRKVIERQNSTRKEERIYLGGFEIYREFNPSTGSGQAIKLERESLHVMDDMQRIALVETKTIEDGQRLPTPEVLQRYQLGNHLGSASLELDDKAIVISYEEYYPYGSTSYQAVNKDIKAAAKRYRYTGKERDEESGLYYHGARYYAPWLGRWTVPDPTGLKDGLNLYSYVRGNPEALIDPAGTQSQGSGRKQYPGDDIPEQKIRDWWSPENEKVLINEQTKQYEQQLRESYEALKKRSTPITFFLLGPHHFTEIGELSPGGKHELQWFRLRIKIYIHDVKDPVERTRLIYHTAGQVLSGDYARAALPTSAIVGVSGRVAGAANAFGALRVQAAGRASVLAPPQRRGHRPGSCAYLSLVLTSNPTLRRYSRTS